MSEKQARMKYGDIKVGTYPYSASGRALTTGDDTGLVKIIAENIHAHPTFSESLMDS